MATRAVAAAAAAAASRQTRVGVRTWCWAARGSCSEKRKDPSRLPSSEEDPQGPGSAPAPVCSGNPCLTVPPDLPDLVFRGKGSENVQLQWRTRAHAGAAGLHHLAVGHGLSRTLHRAGEPRWELLLFRSSPPSSANPPLISRTAHSRTSILKDPWTTRTWLMVQRPPADRDRWGGTRETV